ncbi:MAG: hypothetical protein KIS78_13605 [Labilithrix sp.]|nr:hypothetical protein [Labilithrix sp.]
MLIAASVDLELSDLRRPMGERRESPVRGLISLAPDAPGSAQPSRAFVHRATDASGGRRAAAGAGSPAVRRAPKSRGEPSILDRERAMARGDRIGVRFGVGST